MPDAHEYPPTLRCVSYRQSFRFRAIAPPSVQPAACQSRSFMRPGSLPSASPPLTGSGCGPAWCWSRWRWSPCSAAWRPFARSASPGCRWRPVVPAGRLVRGMEPHPAPRPPWPRSLTACCAPSKEPSSMPARSRRDRAEPERRRFCRLRRRPRRSRAAHRPARLHPRSRHRRRRCADPSLGRRAPHRSLAAGCAASRDRSPFSAAIASAPWSACCRRRSITIPASGAARIFSSIRASPPPPP